MDEVYINAKNFRNDDLSIEFKKDLISIDELVDKVYELLDINEELNDKLDEATEEIRMLERELSCLKNGYRPDDM